MSQDQNNIIPFPTTPSSDNTEPTNQDLEPYVTAFLEQKREQNPQTKLTADIVLKSAVIRDNFVKQYRADQQRKQEEEAAALAAELAEAEKEFLPPASPVQTKVVKPSALVEPVIPHQVELCRNRMVGLFPGCVFEIVEAAAAMRFHLVCCLRPVQNMLKHEESNWHPLYLQRLREFLARVQESINLINQVIMAWGKDPKSCVADRHLILHVRTLLEGDPQFGYLWNPPSMKEIREQERQQAAEAEKCERRRVLRAALCELLEQADGDSDSIHKIAGRLVRKFDDLEDPLLILKAAAVEKVIETKNPNDPVVKLYAKAANISGDDIAKAVEERRGKEVGSSPVSKLTQREKQVARAATDNAARPKPNPGVGDITRLGYTNPNGAKPKKK